MGRLMGTVDVVVVLLIVAVVHHISWAAVRAGSSNTWAASWAGRSRAYRSHISWAAARPGPSKFDRMGRDPARPIRFRQDGPRPDPAHQFFNFSRPGSARPVTIFRSARPCPAQTNGPLKALVFYAVKIVLHCYNPDTRYQVFITTRF